MSKLVGCGNAELAALVGIPIDPSQPLQLEIVRGRLQLRDTRESAPGPIFVDVSSTEIKRRVQAIRELPLVKAICGKTRDISVIDATAGLGRDAIVLAKANCNVTAIEANTVIAELLKDGIARSSIQNLLVIKGDALELLASQAKAKVVYLDPMFPARSKTAAVKKEMQYLQQLELPNTNYLTLLTAARDGGATKIVIKRPAKSLFVDGKPNHSIGGKTVRFDVYLN